MRFSSVVAAAAHWLDCFWHHRAVVREKETGFFLGMLHMIEYAEIKLQHHPVSFNWIFLLFLWILSNCISLRSLLLTVSSWNQHILVDLIKKFHLPQTFAHQRWHAMIEWHCWWLLKIRHLCWDDCTYIWSLTEHILYTACCTLDSGLNKHSEPNQISTLLHILWHNTVWWALLVSYRGKGKGPVNWAGHAWGD